MKKTIKIKDLEHLKKILHKGYDKKDGYISNYFDFAIALNGGCFSRKEIAVYYTKKGLLRFDVRNCIDDSHQALDEKKIMDSNYTNIGEAIKKGSFYQLIY